MNKRINNLIVYVSSRNNYDMLENEVFKNINLEGFEFINVDDCSEPEEQKKGKAYEAATFSHVVEVVHVGDEYLCLPSCHSPFYILLQSSKSHLQHTT